MTLCEDPARLSLKQNAIFSFSFTTRVDQNFHTFTAAPVIPNRIGSKIIQKISNPVATGLSSISQPAKEHFSSQTKILRFASLTCVPC